MSTKRIVWIAMVALALLSLACTSAAPGGGAADPGPPPEDVIAQMVNQAMDLLASGDIDSLMAMYADDFSSDQGMDKNGMQQFLQGAKDQGFLEGMTTSTDAMVVTVAGDTAQVEGVSVEGAFGALTLGFGLAQREGNWIIVSQTQQ